MTFLKFPFPLEKKLEVGSYSLREKSILKVIDDVNWIYFDPTGEPPPPELFQIKYVLYSLKYIGDSHLYLVAFDKYMDTLNKPMEKQFDDFMEMITKVDIVEYTNNIA